MSTVYLCPGKTIMNHEDQIWYKTIDPPTKIYCESCFKEHSNEIDCNMFHLETGKGYYCQWVNNFTNFGLINNTKVYIVDMNTFYRYPINKANGDYMRVYLPNNTKYMIIIENCEENDSKLSIKNVMHGDVQNTIYSELGDNLVIKTMSYTHDLLFNEESNKLVNILLDRWKKDYVDGVYYLINNDPINIVIELIRDDFEYEKMTELLKYYKKLEVNKRKIIIVDNFI